MSKKNWCFPGLALAALVLSLTAGSVVAQGPMWEPVLIGSTGGFFPDGVIDSPFRVAVDPSNADVIYMGTGVIPTPGEPPPPADGLWKTIDGGDSWTQINEPSTGDPDLDFFELTADTTLLDVAVCAANPQILAVAANPKGFFRSEDGGSTWSWIAGGIVHTDADPGHCGALSHPDETFDTVNGRWTGAAVAFDPNDCDTMYAGAADLNAIDLGIGTGDHPGVFKTTDGGATWSALNGAFDPRVDALSCNGGLVSKSVAPISLAVGGSGDVYLASTEQEADANIFGKNAESQLRVWTNSGAGNWTEVSNGLAATEISQGAGFGELVAATVSAGFIRVSPTDNFFVVSHLGIASKILLSGTEITYKSTGIYATLDLSNWVPRDTGIPVISDGLSSNAQNVIGAPTVNPGNTSLWVAGNGIADVGNDDGSQVYGGPNFGANWVNAGGLIGGLSDSPTGLTESSIFFIEWDANGACLYATVLWDFRGGSTTVDDGLYRACIF